MLQTVVKFYVPQTILPLNLLTVTPIDFVYNCQQITLPQAKLFIRPLTTTISTAIPNIYSTSTFKNNIIRLRRNLADPWTSFTLKNGRYNAAQIEAIINVSCNTWYTDPNYPALKIEDNPVTNSITITIDSTKLTAGGTQFCLDISSANSDIYKILGFASTTVFNADGVYSNTVVPNFSPQGLMCNIICDLMPFSYTTNGKRRILFSIPMSKMSGNNTTITYPDTDNRVMTFMEYEERRNISFVKFDVQNEYGVPLYFLEAPIIIEFDICSKI